MTDSVFLVDTNILVYAYDAADRRKHGMAARIIGRCMKQEEQLAVSPQNLSEFFSVTTSKRLLTKAEAAAVIADIVNFSYWVKLDFNALTVLDAARISDGHAMSYWDSLLAATMRQHGISALYTENTGDFKVPWLRAVNPFERK